MHNDLLIGVALIVFLGTLSQLVAWRTQTPSILLLLAVGILAGPVMGWIDVDHLLGDLLFPLVSLSVAIILFEGGLSLRFKELRTVGKVVRNLIIVGVLVTWIVSGFAAYFILGLSVELSILLGSVLVVTGPTVIIPMLKQIRPASRVSSILRWEGIAIDPVGAILAVLVFEELVAAGNNELGFLTWGFAIVKTLLIGFGGGWLMSKLMIELYARYIVPHSLQNPLALTSVILAFTISNLLQPESGLVTVTVMGYFATNQTRVDMRHIIEFKENLQVLLISALFIMLAARIDRTILDILNWRTVAFIAIIILIERPVSVWIGTMGSGLNWRERLFIGWMAPRGIVAAAVSSIFAAELVEAGYPGAEVIVLYTFAVIISTVTIYSLTSGRLANALGLAERKPQGVLILGAQPWVRNIGCEILAQGFRVILADANPRNILEAQQLNLETYHGNILSEVIVDDIDFAGVGRFVALTPNDEVNSLANIHFKTVFGQNEVYQLAENDADESISSALSGRTLFGEHITHDYLQERFNQGATVQTIEVDHINTMKQHLQTDFTPLFMVHKGQLHIWTAKNPPQLIEGAKIIGFVDTLQG